MDSKEFDEGNEFVLFAALADFKNEEQENVDMTILGVCSALHLLKPSLTEVEFKQYLRLAGIDIEDIDTWHRASYYFSGVLAHSVIQVTEFDEPSLLNAVIYVDARNMELFIRYAQSVRDETAKMKEMYD